jgi:predicted transcriptional regulator
MPDEKPIGLRQMRDALGVNQVDLASRLGITQAGLSKLERKPDVYIGSARKIVEAMGGTLDVVARFPGREPIRLGWPAGSEEAG